MFKKMSQKINLKNIKKVEAVTTTSNQLKNPDTKSPFFSPISHRTRQRINEKETKVLDSKTKPLLSKDISTKSAQLSPEKPSRPHIKIEYDADDAKLNENIQLKSEKPSKRSPIDQKPIKRENNDPSETEADEKQSKWEPNNWLEIFANIREMRKLKGAPVDTMGCHKCSDTSSDEKTQRFHHLIALMLSSQTKDGVTYDAMTRLKDFGLTPMKMVEIPTNNLEKLLCPVSFYKTKAKNIQKAAQILIDNFDSDIPKDIKGLVSLPGVGPKMAHICMRVAWNEITGIGVDTHVHRIVNRLKWVPKETKEPEQTRIALEKWLPFEHWTEINELLVGFGQMICTPTNPKCGECLNHGICPYGNVMQ